MQTIFLKDGRMADLITKTEKGYLVDPYVTFKYYEDNEETAPSGNVELVQEIFSTAPTDFIEAECQKIYDRTIVISARVDELTKQKNDLTQEVESLKRQKTDLGRYIINREELRTAKRLILWPSNEIVPRIMDGSVSNKFTVSYEISQYKNEERCWCYKVWSEGNDRGWSNHSTYFDEKYGIKTDLTDDEILKLTQERIERFKKDYHSWKHTLMGTPDEWLTPEYIEEKNKLLEEKRTSELNKAVEELKNAQSKLEKIKNELAVS
jgi:hypothetical protein